MFMKFSLNRMLALVVAAGFLLLAVDSFIEHWTILGQDLPAWIPGTFGAAAFCIALYTVINWKDRSIRLLRYTLLAAIIVSCAGLYFHLGEDEEETRSAERMEHEAKEKEKPLLAPLSFAGVAAVGLLGTSRKWRAELLSPDTPSTNA